QVSEGLKQAVFLDRDGVLNRAVVRDGRPYPPATVEEFEILPGAAEAARKPRDAGFLVIGATNRPDVARGSRERRPHPPDDQDAADVSEAADWILSDPERRTTP